MTIIESNLSEAKKELEKLCACASKRKLNEAELQIGLRHVYHHLNFVWNIRHKSTSQYANLTKAQFYKWGRYPSEIEEI